MIKKFILTIAVSSFLLAITSFDVFACTGVYVGKKASLDGTTIIARSEDQPVYLWNKMFFVQEEKEEEGNVITDTGTGVSYPVPHHTFKYTFLDDGADTGDGRYFASCTNECGVAVIGSVTIYQSESYACLDPLNPMGAGLREAVIPGILACQSSSAREAVSVLEGYIASYGAAESGSYLISDKKETWVFEIYGGLTYAAQRLPDDMMLVFGNEPVITAFDFNDSESFVFSPSLPGVLAELPEAVWNEDGTANLSLSFNPYPRVFISSPRSWMGKILFAPSSVGEYSSYQVYSGLFYPEKKVSVLDVMKVYENRYYGTQFDKTYPGNEACYAIGYENTSDVHIIQTFSSLPDETCLLQWLSVGSGEMAIFVPSFSGITETFDKYHIESTAENAHEGFYYVSKAVTEKGRADRFGTGLSIKEEHHRYEKLMLKSLKSLLPLIRKSFSASSEEGQRFVTQLAKSYAGSMYTKELGLLEK